MNSSVLKYDQSCRILPAATVLQQARPTPLDFVFLFGDLSFFDWHDG
jgi:hypothetical protein